MTTKQQDQKTMERIARERFGFEHLFPAQRKVIQSLLDGRDTLAVMPTGSGKSAIYQIAGLMLERPTVIVSPLLALQRDQVESLQGHGIDDAAAVNSTISAGDRQEALEALADNHLDFLFTAPEQFRHEETLGHLHEATPALFVVDEAHCISEWGDDFRPDYLRLGPVIEALGHPTVLAVTATASSRVRDEIIERLGMRNPTVLVEGFDRPNIWLGVQRYHDDEVKRRELLDAVDEAAKPGIVYVSTHAHAESLAAHLQERGINAMAYHGGMKTGDRESVQETFMERSDAVIVATAAFGMGVDKSDVRFVFHYDIPDSVDTYYQEIGRAGRDDEPARALLFYRPEDLNLHRFFAGSGQVDAEQVTQVAQAIQTHRGPMSTQEIEEATDLSRAKITTATTRLEEAGAIAMLPTGEVRQNGSGIAGTPVVDEALHREEQRRASDASRLEMIRGYAEVQDCRREYLLNYFGEAYEAPCGNCDNCQAGIVATEDEEDTPFPLHSRVRHGTFGEGDVQRYEGDKMVVLFDDVGYKELLTQLVVESGALRSIHEAP